MSDNYYPGIFIAAIGGYTGCSYRIQWDGAQLKYEIFGYGEKLEKTITIIPKSSTWGKFWAKMEKIQAWDWRGEYLELGILDGTYWKVEIIFNDKQLKSDGSNAFPPEFDRFLKAVRKLLGGKDFA